MCRLEKNTGVIMYTSTSNIARVDLKVQQASQLSAVTMLSHEKYKVYVWGERQLTTTAKEIMRQKRS